jgi:serine/threonine-protein kinase RsbW
MATNPPLESVSVEVPQDRAQIDRVMRELLAAMERRQYNESSRFAVRLAMEEAISNAFRHGHQGMPETTPIRVDYRLGDKELTVTVEDQGPGFDPKGVPDPTLDENLELPSGRGLVLIRAYMSDVRYEGRGNRLRMVYRRPAGRG